MQELSDSRRRNKKTAEVNIWERVCDWTDVHENGKVDYSVYGSIDSNSILAKWAGVHQETVW
jgi:hypothetical protein